MGQSGYGVLKASASAAFNISGPPQIAYSTGQAAFRDVITVSFAPWTGTAGLLYVRYRLNGTVSAAGNGAAGIFVQTYGGPTDSQDMVQYYATSTSGFFSAPMPIRFIYGQPFDLGLELDTQAGTVSSSGLITRSGSGFGLADFSDTLILSGLIPTDLSGIQADGAQFSSESGTVYSVDGVVPEPAAFGLLSLSAALTAITLKARSRVRRVT